MIINSKLSDEALLNAVYLAASEYANLIGNPDEVSELLNLTPEKTWKIGDLRRNGTIYDFALWEIGRCTEYDD